MSTEHEAQLLATVDHLEAALSDALEALRCYRVERAADGRAGCTMGVVNADDGTG